MKWTWNRETARSLAVDSEFPNVSRVTPKKSQRPGRYLDDFPDISRGEQRPIFLFISVSRSCLSSLNSQVQLHFLYESDFIPCLLNVFLLQTEAPLLACFHDSKRNMMMMKVTIMTKIGDDNGFWSNSHFHWGSD